MPKKYRLPAQKAQDDMKDHIRNKIKWFMFSAGINRNTAATAMEVSLSTFDRHAVEDPGEMRLKELFRLAEKVHQPVTAFFPE